MRSKLLLFIFTNLLLLAGATCIYAASDCGYDSSPRKPERFFSPNKRFGVKVTQKQRLVERQQSDEFNDNEEENSEKYTNTYEATFLRKASNGRYQTGAVFSLGDSLPREILVSNNGDYIVLLEGWNICGDADRAVSIFHSSSTLIKHIPLREIFTEQDVALLRQGERDTIYLQSVISPARRCSINEDGNVLLCDLSINGKNFDNTNAEIEQLKIGLASGSLFGAKRDLILYAEHRVRVEASDDAQADSDLPADVLLESVIPVDAIRINSAEFIGKVINRTDTPYPAVARVARIKGTVIVEIFTDEKGAVVAARVLSGKALLRPMVRKVVLQWTFRPTEVDGAFVKTRGTIAFVFEHVVVYPDGHTRPVDY